MQPMIPHPVRNPSPPHLFLLVHMAAFAECHKQMVEMYGADATFRIISILNEQTPQALSDLIEYLERSPAQSLLATEQEASINERVWSEERVGVCCSTDVAAGNPGILDSFEELSQSA